MLFELTNELSIYQADEIKEYFITLLQKEESISLDMQKIEKIDLVGIQLLLSLVKSQKAIKQTISFKNFEQNILDEIALCQCSDALGVQNG